MTKKTTAKTTTKTTKIEIPKQISGPEDLQALHDAGDLPADWYDDPCPILRQIEDKANEIMELLLKLDRMKESRRLQPPIVKDGHTWARYYTLLPRTKDGKLGLMRNDAGEFRAACMGCTDYGTQCGDAPLEGRLGHIGRPDYAMVGPMLFPCRECVDKAIQADDCGLGHQGWRKEPCKCGLPVPKFEDQCTHCGADLKG